MIELQICDKCKSQFNWGQIMKSLWGSYRPIQCRKCTTKHQLTIVSRMLVVFFMYISLMLLGFFLLYKWSISIRYTAFIMIVYGMILSLFLPYFVTYRSDKG